MTQNTRFAYDHGDYAAEINTNYLGLVGPEVANLGLDGSAANAGPNSAGPNSGQTTVPGSGTTGTWLDETDIRPTVLYLLGLHDDYMSDGRVITQVLTNRNSGLSAPGVAAVGGCYKQINSSVGELGTDTLMASTRALESNSPGDAVYTNTEQKLSQLEQARDAVAEHIKTVLDAAEFGGGQVRNAPGLLASCTAVLNQARRLAG